MITLILIVYILLAAYFSIQNMRGGVVENEFIELKRPIPAIAEGLILPLLVFIAIAFYLVKYTILVVVIIGAILGVLWVLANMP